MLTDAIHFPVDSGQPHSFKDLVRFLTKEPKVKFPAHVGVNNMETVIIATGSERAEGQKGGKAERQKDRKAERRKGGKAEDTPSGKYSENVLFFCVDGLKGFNEAIRQVYPLSFIQRCIVHMIRTSVRFVSDKDIKKVCKDLRAIYGAADENQAQLALEPIEQTWGSKYKEIAPAWRANRKELMTYMQFGKDLRRMIYTTNAVAALHRQMRKEGWKKIVFGWLSIQREIIEYFGERYSKYLQ